MVTLAERRRWIRGFQKVIVSSSGGKDSLSALHKTVEAAEDAGVLDRVVVLHLDLGHVEWPGALEIAKAQADFYGVRFEVRGREAGGLLDLVRARGRFPSDLARFCTSSLKRGPARKFYTETVREIGASARPVRLLSVMGLRAAESKARAKRPEVAVDHGASSGRREVTVWHPVHQLSTVQTWDLIDASGAPWHTAYRFVGRLSCSLCPLASLADLVVAAALRPDLAAQYAALEEEIGQPFQRNRTMAQIIDRAAGLDLGRMDFARTAVCGGRP